MDSRISKTELAQMLGGSFISKKGNLNSEKLKDYVCSVLKIDGLEYKKSRLFNASQIAVFVAKGVIILPTHAESKL